MKGNIFLMGGVFVLITLLVGCNMMKGAGKDMENAGEGIQKIVDKND